MASNDEPLKIDDDSLSELAGAKQGKPRKFCMVYRGAKIFRLLVYRRGKAEAKRAEAKRGQAGEVCDGVIVGKGANLTFQLLAAEYPKVPTGPSILRKFLEEAAEFKSQAIFEIVTSLPFVFDESNPLVARFLPLKDAAEATAEADAEAAPRINELCLRIGKAFDAEEANKTIEPLLADLERLISGGSGRTPTETQSPPKPSDSTPPPPPPPPPTPVLAQVKEGLFRLSEQVRRAVAAFPERREECFAAFAKTQEFVKQQAVDEAKKSFGELVALLKGLAAVTSDDGKIGEFRKSWPGTKQFWFETLESVDEQIEKLASTLRATDDAELHEIAEFGLNAVTGDFRVPVARAVLELDVVNDEFLSLAAQQLTTAVADFRAHVNSSDEIMACDENPFNVKVAIRATLGQAFDKLEAVAKPLVR